MTTLIEMMRVEELMKEMELSEPLVNEGFRC
jgi:hypothetical protein